MANLSASARARLVEVAERHFGSGGRELLESCLHDVVGTELETLRYAQAGALLRAMADRSPQYWVRDRAGGLSRSLLEYADQVDAALSARIETALQQHIGKHAPVFLRTLCQRGGLDPQGLQLPDLPALLILLRQEASTTFGAEGAAEVVTAVQAAAEHGGPEVALEVDHLARQWLGPGGERLVRDFVRRRFEIELADLDLNGVKRLAEAVSEHATELSGDGWSEAFISDARAAMLMGSPEIQERLRVLSILILGPAGPKIVRKACTTHGLPWEAIDADHLLWLAGILKQETEGVVGPKVAAALSAQVQSLANPA